eukprot:jgi/Bigna1/88004/estExt_fgenesh1_pg.C_270026
MPKKKGDKKEKGDKKKKKKEKGADKEKKSKKGKKEAEVPSNPPPAESKAPEPPKKPEGGGGDAPPQLSAETKVAMLQRTYDSQIVPKRSHLLNELQRLEAARNLIEAQASEIEATARREFEASLSRLHDAKAEKLNNLEGETNQIRVEVAEMERLVADLADFKKAKSAEEMTKFLSVDRELHHRMYRLAGAPSRVGLEINPYDLPRDHDESHKLRREYAGARKIIQVKDEMIEYLLQEREGLLKAHANASHQAANLNNAAQHEMKQWVRLTDKFAQELDQFQLACRYCKAPLSRLSVNTYCPYNRKIRQNQPGGGANEFRQHGDEGSGLHRFEPTHRRASP